MAIELNHVPWIKESPISFHHIENWMMFTLVCLAGNLWPFTKLFQHFWSESSDHTNESNNKRVIHSKIISAEVQKICFPGELELRINCSSLYILILPGSRLKWFIFLNYYSFYTFVRLQIGLQIGFHHLVIRLEQI